MSISFGIKTTQVNASYDEILRVWREADEIGVFDSAWVWDHLVPMRGEVTAPALEAWTLLSALAAVNRAAQARGDSHLQPDPSDRRCSPRWPPPWIRFAADV